MTPATPNKYLKIIFVLIFIVLMLAPVVAIFSTNTLKDITKYFSDQSSMIYFLIRVFGLYGIQLLFVEIISGSFMPYFLKLFNKPYYKFHIFVGIVSYIIITLHLISYFTFGLINTGKIDSNILSFSNNYNTFLSVGKIAFPFLTIAVFAGIFRFNRKIVRHWKLLHKFNYLAFFMAISHSFKIGSDTQTSPYIYLYPFFIAGHVLILWKKVKKTLQRNQLN